MQRTPLYDAHLRLGAKMVDFGGWAMPVSYPGGILDEHRATREAVGVFDVCHMGEIHFRGSRAAEAVQRLVTNDLGRLNDGRALYTVACLPSGGILDDLIVYRLAADHYLTVVNASTLEKDRAWFFEHARSLCEVVDASAETGLIAFQGPGAKHALQPLTKSPLGELPRFAFVDRGEIAGVQASIARTGYTGEDGFEIFCAAQDAPALWDRLLEAAAGIGGKAVGLGARDTLRLEARLPLYGNDLDETTTPLEAGLGWVVKLDGADFIGREALLAQKQAGLRRRLCGFVMTGRGIARHGYPIYSGSESAEAIGATTSGGPAPTAGKNVGLGYLPVALDRPGTPLSVDCRGKRVDAEVVQGPFYKRDREPKERGRA
ncbi:MAG TPA: glycine cleavage system aminomethyltransferase GcvT [Polyangia bacterium]|jgi:aminomethyltransferase